MPSTYSSPIVFRKFSELDLREIIFIKNQLNDGKQIGHVDMNTVISDIFGVNIFQIFMETSEINNKIHEEFEELA